MVKFGLYCIFAFNRIPSSFARKNLILSGLSIVVFLVINSVGVFRLSVSGNARFFLLSKLCVSSENSLN